MRINLLKLARYKLYLSFLASYLTLYSVFGFALFIEEEAIQSCQFGGWQFERSQDYKGIAINADLMENLNRTLKITNWAGGWLNPVGFFAYRGFAKATDRYIESLRSNVLAHAPQVLSGRRLTFNFMYRSKEITPTGYLLKNGKLHISTDKLPETNPFTLTGFIEDRNTHVHVKALE